MKGTLKTKITAILLIIFILVDMLSPYSILLNKSYAADVEPYFFIRKNSNIEVDPQSGARTFELLLGFTGDELINILDVELKYNTSKLSLLNSSGDILTTDDAQVSTAARVKRIMTPYVDDFYTTTYGADTLTSIDPATGRITINAMAADQVTPVEFVEDDWTTDYWVYQDGDLEGEPREIPEGYNGFIPLYTLNVVVLDENITDDTLTQDLITLNPNNRTETGFDLILGDDTEIKDTAYVKYDGFKSSETVKNIQNVIIETRPTKVNYEHGDTVDLTDGVLKIEYTDNSSTTEPMADNPKFVLDNQRVVVGQSSIKGKYEGGYSIEYPITVTDPVETVTIEGELLDPNYNQGETISLEGISLRVKTKSEVEYNSDGKLIELPDPSVQVDTGSRDEEGEEDYKANINAEYIVDSGRTTPEGFKIILQTIKLTYEGKTATVDILVNDTMKEITGVTGYQETYEWGTAFNINQGNITLVTTSGATFTVPFSKVGIQGINGYNPNKLGPQDLTVTYLEKTSPTFSITVTDPIVGIEVTPFKSTYQPGEALDFSGSKIYEKGKSTAKYNEMDLATAVEQSLAKVTNYYPEKVGGQTLTISYRGKTTTYEVTVEDAIKSIRVDGMKTTYEYGQNLDLTNAKVVPIMYSGTEAASIPLTSDMITTTFNPTEVGQQTVTVVYEGKRFDIEVTVNDAVKSISIDTTPETRYKYGEGVKVENGKIKVEWQSGKPATTENITADMVKEMDGKSFTSIVTFKPGETTVTKNVKVVYGGQEAIYQVTIVNEITKIEMKTLPKTQYNVNDPLDVTGGEITITRQVGTEDKALDASWVTGFNSSTNATNQTLTVTYKENDVTKTTSYKVNIVDQVKSIAVTSQPNKKEYGYGEALNLEGAKMTVVYGSHTEENVQITNDMVNYVPTQTGAQYLTVTFNGVSDNDTTIDVTVVDKLVSIKIDPDDQPKVEYKLNEGLSRNGSIIITRQSGATEKKQLGAQGVTITGFDSSAETPAQELTIKYEEQYAESSNSAEIKHTINVKDRITKIDMNTLPQTEFNYGDIFSTTNGKVLVTKESTLTEIIDLSECNVEGYDPNELGDQVITVSYTRYGDTRTTTYHVNVNNYVDHITVTPPTKTSYGYGDPLELAGGSVTATMADNTTTTVALTDPAVTIVNKDTITNGIGTIKVTVEYAGKSATFDIQVQDEIESVDLVGNIKTIYEYGDPFDPAGAYILIKSKSNPNATRKEITADMVSGFDSTKLTENEPTGSRILEIRAIADSDEHVFKIPYYVNDKVTGIELVPPTTTRYTYTTNPDAKLNITGASVRKIMASGAEVLPVGLDTEGVQYGTKIDEGIEYEPSKLGSQTVYVRYANFEKTFTIYVRDELVSISLTTDPKTEYIYGDKLQTNGARIRVTKLSGTSEIDLTENLLSNFYTQAQDGISAEQALTNGTPRTATITYSWGDTGDEPKTATTTFRYTVEDKVDDVNLVEPKTKKYYYGETPELDLTGGSVQKVMRSGIVQEIVDLEDIRESVTGYNYRPATLGTQIISVNYSGITKTFEIEVADRLEGISIVDLPEQTYFVGDTMNLAGGKVRVDRLKDDEEITLPSERVRVDDFSTATPTAAGSKRTATVVFTEGDISKEATFEYVVNDYISSVAVVPPTKTEYYLNDSEELFNQSLSTGSIAVTMASGNPASNISLVDENVIVTGFDSSSVGEKTINVSYKNEKGETISAGTFKVTVYDEIKEVRLIGTPKDEYLYGEKIDLNGAYLEVEKISGTSDVQITEDMISGFNTKELVLDKTATITYTDNSAFLKIPEGVNKVTFNYSVTDYGSGIADITPPTNVKYYLNDEESEFTLEGGYIEVVKASGDGVEKIDLSDTSKVKVSGFDTSETGKQKITVEYTNENGQKFTTEFEIEVWDKLESVTIEGMPKTDYLFGDKLELNGAKLVVNKLSGTTKIDITEEMVTNFMTDSLTDGRIAVVTYPNEDSYLEILNDADKATFDYTVKDFIKSVTLKAPTKAEYDYGTDLDLSDGYLIITMASGATAENVPLTDSEVHISGYNKNVLGPQVVSIEYKGFTEGLTFGVEVVNKVKDVEFNVDSITDTEYKYGENLKLDNATAVIEMLDGTKKTVQIDNSMISGYDPTKLGDQEVTITVEGIEKTITVTVVDYVTEIELTPPTKNIYVVKEQLDLKGGKLKVTMASGKVIDNILLTDPKVKVSGYVATQLGSQTVKVVYDNYTKLAKEFTVQVVDKLADISIESLPNKTQYKYGENLDLTGAKLRVTSESGKYEIIDITEEMLTTKFDPTKLGTQTITVEYKVGEETRTTEFAVVVEDYVKEIKFTKPEKTDYKYGEELDLTGAKFTEILASGKVNKEVNVTKEMVTGFNNKVVGKQMLTATYGEVTGTFQVTVVDNTISIAITSLPNKVEYLKGEALDLTGGKITVIKDSGIYNLDITNDMVSGYDPNVVGAQVVTITYNGVTAQLSVVVKDIESTDNGDSSDNESETTKPIKPNKPSGQGSSTDNVIGGIITDNTSDENTNANASVNEDKENNNDVDKDITLGEKSESSDNDKESQSNILVKTATVAGLGIVALIALVFIVKRRTNVRIYEEDENELILIGKEKLNAEDRVLDLSKYVQKAPEKNMVVVLNNNIAKKLDKQKLVIKLNDEELDTIVEYENGEFEIRLEK